MQKKPWKPRREPGRCPKHLARRSLRPGRRKVPGFQVPGSGFSESGFWDLEPGVNKLPRDIQDLGAAIPGFSFAMLRNFHEAGVDLLIGTDSHSGLLLAGRSGLDEMDLFVQAGLKPYDALKAATFNAAKVLKRLDDLGTIAAGKQADLVLVEENPLDSLQTLRHPLAVVAGGRYYGRQEIDGLKRPK